MVCMVTRLLEGLLRYHTGAQLHFQWVSEVERLGFEVDRSLPRLISGIIPPFPHMPFGAQGNFAILYFFLCFACKFLVSSVWAVELFYFIVQHIFFVVFEDL